MWDFSDDEIVFLIVSAIAAAGLGVPLWIAAARISTLGRSWRRKIILLCAPLLLLAPTIVTLNMFADPQVVEHLDYNVLFLFGALGLIAIGARASPLLGIHVRDDVIDRDNPAAMIAVLGLLLGTSLIYALANIGTGPTIWTTVVPAIIAVGGLWALAMLITACGGGWIDAVTIDRDVASAIRFGGAMVGIGLILGRAAAGNWISWDKTFEDLQRFGGPALVPATLSIGFQHWLKPRPQSPRPDVLAAGIWPATMMIAIAIALISLLPHGWNLDQW